MVTTPPRSFLVSFEDVLNSFGFQLSSVREPRITQESFAQRINVIAATEQKALKRQISDRREELEEKIKTAESAITEIESVEQVTGDLVAEWEEGAKFPSPTQYQRIKKALNAVRTLTATETEALDDAYKGSAKHASHSSKTATFAAALRQIMRTMRKTDNTFTEEALAEYMRLAGELNEIEKLHQQKHTLKDELDALPLITPKHYFLVDSNGKKQDIPLNDQGTPKISSEHLRLIEHGIIPSQDLYAIIIAGLSQGHINEHGLGHLNINHIDAGEAKDLEAKYRDLIREATDHFGILKRRGLLNEDPLNGYEPPITASPALPPVTDIAPPPVPPEPAPKESALITPPAHDTQAEEHTYTIAPALPAAIAAPAAAAFSSSITKPQKRELTFRPTPKPGMVARLAEIYVELLRAHGIKAPSDPMKSADALLDTLADKIGQKSADMDSLRPFSLKPLSPALMAALAGDNEATVRLCHEYNSLVNGIYNNISTYKDGDNPTLPQALEAVERMIKDDKNTKHIFDDLKKLNSLTGISQSDFDDYFRHGGLRMGYGRDIIDVLSAANNQWFKEGRKADKHNVFKQTSTIWRKPIVTYIDTHHAVQDEHEKQAEAFKLAVERLVEDQKHEHNGARGIR